MLFFQAPDEIDDLLRDIGTPDPVRARGQRNRTAGIRKPSPPRRPRHL